MTRRRAATLIVIAVAGALTACAGGDGASPRGGRTATSAAGTVSTAGGVRLTRIAVVEEPVALAVRPNDNALYIAERTGRVRAIPNGQTATPTPSSPALVLDLSRQVATGTEQGLLGLVFSPDGIHLYVDYTDARGDTHIVEYGFRDGRADESTRRELLFIKDFASNHNGGHLAFGADGFLYIAQGDGGGGGDPQGNGQKLTSLLGKILRIDPRADGERPYRVPADNPFATRGDARPEIWAYGLRNPWRFSFDRATGDLWIGDVGQNAWEEVDRVPRSLQPGANLGWNLREGPARFRGEPPQGALEPVFSYPTREGCSVVGGYVYRGTKVGALKDTYLLADACSGKITALPVEGVSLGKPRVLELDTPTARRGEVSGYSISSFGEDAAGELYVLSLSGDVLRIDPA